MTTLLIGRFTYGALSLAAAQKADQVFLPVLENAMKAQKLRTTLGVFDRSKFFFNLPSSLVECIEAVSRTSLKLSYSRSNASAMKPGSI